MLNYSCNFASMEKIKMMIIQNVFWLNVIYMIRPFQAHWCCDLQPFTLESGYCTQGYRESISVLFLKVE